MLVPVLERFAESGWSPFVQPAEFYEFFHVSGTFKRANVDSSHTHLQAAVESNSNKQEHYIEQRNALFDVCLQSGLAHLISAYIHAVVTEDATITKSFYNQEQKSLGRALNQRDYVLKDPVAVKQWLQKRLLRLEKANDHIPSDIFTKKDDLSKEKLKSTLENRIREINGLRTIAIALVERLKEGCREFSKFGSGQDLSYNSSALQELAIVTEHDARIEATELPQLTKVGLENLVELLYRIQFLASSTQCLLWMWDQEMVICQEELNRMFMRRRQHRRYFFKLFQDKYGLHTINQDTTNYEQLFIENVLKNADISTDDVVGDLPPTSMNAVLDILKCSNIQKLMVLDIANTLHHSFERDSVVSYFSVQLAIMMYFCLDIVCAHYFMDEHNAEIGMELIIQRAADSFAAHMDVREDMKLTLLALWLIENAVVLSEYVDDMEVDDRTNMQDRVYNLAIKCLHNGSIRFLHQRFEIEAELLIHIVTTLLHRGEYDRAFKIVNIFNQIEDVLPTEVHTILALEVMTWERALTIIRKKKRSDLIVIILLWLEQHRQMKDFLERVSLQHGILQSYRIDSIEQSYEEEEIFKKFMLVNYSTDETILNESSIQRADQLVMYYALRQRYDEAWHAHYHHLALLREAAVMKPANALLDITNQLSFRVRTSLLQALAPEPKVKESYEYTYTRERVSHTENESSSVAVDEAAEPLRPDGGMQDYEMQESREPSTVSPAAKSQSLFGKVMSMDPQSPDRVRAEGSPNEENTQNSRRQSFDPETYVPGMLSSAAPRTPMSIPYLDSSSPHTLSPSDEQYINKTPPKRATRIGSVESSPRSLSVDNSDAEEILKEKNNVTSTATKNSKAIRSGDAALKSARQYAAEPRNGNISSRKSRAAHKSNDITSTTNGSRDSPDLALHVSKKPPRSASRINPSTSQTIELHSTSTSPSSIGINTSSTQISHSPSHPVIAEPASQQEELQSDVDMDMPATIKFNFVHEHHHETTPPPVRRVQVRKADEKSPIYAEAEGMEIEQIDEEFHTSSQRRHSHSPTNSEGKFSDSSSSIRRNPWRHAREKHLEVRDGFFTFSPSKTFTPPPNSNEQ